VSEHSHDAGLSDRMAAAARELQDQLDPEETYHAAAQLAVDNVAGCDVAALSLVRRRPHPRIETRGSTDDVVVSVDELQHDLDEGPCVDAIWKHTTVHSPSLSHDQRWPRWGPEVVRQTGLHSVLAFQLFTHQDTVGALNLFSRRKDAFGDTDRVDGLAIAAHISVAIVAAEKIENLEQALATRTVIGQATGMLMERFDLSADRAFAVLTRVSSQTETKLRVIAEELVRSRVLPTHHIDAEP
jgi:transcriptional regulator with GAF, ATPase, and Fis domain